VLAVFHGVVIDHEFERGIFAEGRMHDELVM
jgi:hypothetical protein